MPKLSKRGGDFVQAELVCGFICRGANQSVNKRMQIHKRVCTICAVTKPFEITVTEEATNDIDWRNKQQWSIKVGEETIKKLGGRN